ncbi:MAG: FapA family protein [Deltaproteobacteria bacterium]|jgi:uncharacterized protein (DUF342 family)|nr:FapA family protein [Deltaproteobacteria bacterium]
MSYYLRHYFEPNFDHLAVKPKVSADGRADRHNLGYVQNVIKGQILAEFLPTDQVPDPQAEFMHTTPEFPAGPNTYVDPDHPQYLLADINGYAFYLDDKITVKNVLNVRGDVSFQTGNIFFVGNLAVHGDVRTGFEVQANDILIKGMIEGSIARAQRDLAVLGGVRGRTEGKCLLDAGRSLRLTHVENAEIRSHGRLFVEKFCLHSRLYITGDMAVQGRLYGGVCQTNGTVYVREALGNPSETPTAVELGYNPHYIRQLERCEEHLTELGQRIVHYKAVAGHLPPDANEPARRLAAARYKQKRLQQHRQQLWRNLSEDEKQATRCRVVVPGTVYPGVDISIGRTLLSITRPMQNVMFHLRDEEIVVEQLQAKHSHTPKKHA